MKNIAFILTLLFLLSCQKEDENSVLVTVKNNLDIDRAFETVEIDVSDLKSLKASEFQIIHKVSGDSLVSQSVDYDADGSVDALLFQPKVKANSEDVFQVFASTDKKQEALCYSRFVPERTDDYAWENNRVAFRTYGPTAQQMVEDSIKGGTLSSGMDAWLKRVEYPIIDKWYKKHTSGEGSYHEDTGEGLDNFHVGVSRGVGGVAIKNDSNYMISKNFTSYKTIANGPIRTVFELEYAPYDLNGKRVEETKRISLDYGQNLSKFAIAIKGTNNVSGGLTLHDNLGETSINKAEGWMSYWEPHDGSALGQGLVIKNVDKFKGFDKYISEEKDKSNLFMQIQVEDSKAEYYAGFGWKKSGQFNSKEEWENYLSTFSKCIQNPLVITIENAKP
jgi:hypothetical protein